MFLSLALADVFEKKRKENENNARVQAMYFFVGGGGRGGGGRRGWTVFYGPDNAIHFCMVLSMFWPSYIFFARPQHGTKTLAFPETHDRPWYWYGGILQMWGSNGLLTECAVIFLAEPLSRLFCFHAVLISHNKGETAANSTAQHLPPPPGVEGHSLI